MTEDNVSVVKDIMATIDRLKEERSGLDRRIAHLEKELLKLTGKDS